jgi:hypothetical protein
MKAFSILTITPVYLAVFGTAYANERGVGVSPSIINLSEEENYPVYKEIIVSNLSGSDEWIEISFSQNLIPFALAEPGRFALEKGKAGKITVIFDKPLSLRESLGGEERRARPGRKSGGRKVQECRYRHPLP